MRIESPMRTTRGSSALPAGCWASNGAAANTDHTRARRARGSMSSLLREWGCLLSYICEHGASGTWQVGNLPHEEPPMRRTASLALLILATLPTLAQAQAAKLGLKLPPGFEVIEHADGRLA